MPVIRLIMSIGQKIKVKMKSYNFPWSLEIAHIPVAVFDYDVRHKQLYEFSQ